MSSKFLSLVLALTAGLTMSEAIAMKPASQARKEVDSDKWGQDAVRGLKRQGKGKLGNENAQKLNEQLTPEAKPASGDNSGKK